ncbi:hypothetical protein [Oceanobacillus sp. CAU 1775]
MIEESFIEMIEEFGTSMYLNAETTPRKVLLSSRGISKMEVNFDDRVAHTDFPIKRGDIFTYDDIKYLVYSDVKNKRGHEYQSLIRPMENIITSTYMTEGVYEYDRLGNKVWIEEPTEVTVEVPCIAYQNTTALSTNQIVTLQDELTVIVQDNEATQSIEMMSEHQILNNRYKVEGIDLLQSGIRIITMGWIPNPA